MRREVGEAGGADGGVPDGAPLVAQPKRGTGCRGHQQVVGPLARASAGERLDENGGQGNGALLVCLGCAEEQFAGDFGCRLGDRQALAKVAQPIPRKFVPVRGRAALPLSKAAQSRSA